MSVISIYGCSVMGQEIIMNIFITQQPHCDKNNLFACICPQILVQRKGFMYGPRHMRKHLIKYCKENHGLLQVLLCEQLTQRNLTLDQYMCLMEGTSTCGYELTLLILSQMFNIAILVIRSDFLWVSTQVPPRECPVVIIQNTSGKFLGTKSTCGVHPVSVGTVPKISVNRKRSPVLVNSSTPDDYSRKHAQEFDNMLREKLSPIAEIPDSAKCRLVDSEFDESVDLLANVNKFVITKDSVQCNSAPSKIDAAKGNVHLKIEDIGNDTSIDSVMNDGKLNTNTTNKAVVVKSGGGDNDCVKNDSFGSSLDISAETGDLNESIDYKLVDEEIAKSNTQHKKENPAAYTSQRENEKYANESTLTASKMTDTDDEKSVTIPATTSADGSTLVEERDVQLLLFFPDSEDVSKENDSSSSGEKKDVTDVTIKDKEADAVLERAEMTDERTNDENG